MDRKGYISDYGIGAQRETFRIEAQGIPPYAFGSSGIIKMMKVNGEWVYSEKMVQFLRLNNYIKAS